MPICIECRYPVKTLYTEYSGADDKSSGHGVRLTVCKNCGRFCDKYVEHDFVVLFIDLVLIKPQVCLLGELRDEANSSKVYRHLLHNSLMRADDQFDVRSIICSLEDIADMSSLQSSDSASSYSSSTYTSPGRASKSKRLLPTRQNPATLAASPNNP